MNEVGGGFKHATPGQIACRDKLPAMLLYLGRSLRLQMEADPVLPTAVGRCGVTNEVAAFGRVDEVIAVKLPGLVDNAADVFAVVPPRTIAGAELGNAATLRVHDGARRRVRTLVTVVGNAVAIGVAIIG